MRPPPPLSSGLFPAQAIAHGGHGGSDPAPPTPPSRNVVSRGGCRCIGAAAIAVSALACPSTANASAFASARFGGEQGSVVARNPTALYYNPAGIAYEEGTDVFVDGQLALRHITWDHPRAPSHPVDPPRGEGANTSHASAPNLFCPPALSAPTPIALRRLRLT